MSDARAKAEARRAKILARDRSQKGVSAIGDAAAALPVEGKKVERPLAARRNRVKSVAAGSSAADASEGVVQEDQPKSTAADIVADDDVVDKEMPELVDDSSLDAPDAPSPAVNAKSSSSGADSSTGGAEGFSKLNNKTEDVPSSSAAKTQLARKKSIEEVEKEIAENTAKFDNSATNKSKKEKEKDKKAAEKSIARKKEFLAKKGKVGVVQPHSVQRMARFLLIIAIGVYQGYHVFLRNSSHPAMGLVGGEISSRVLTPDIPGAVDVEVDEFGNAAMFADRITGQGIQHSSEETRSAAGVGTDESSAKERTWGGWLYSKAKAYFEATVTAVSFTYYIGNIVAAPITTRMAQRQQAGAAGNLEKIMEFFQNFIDGIFEYMFCMIGEWSTHVASLIVTVVLLTLHAELRDNTFNAAQDNAIEEVAASAGVAEEL